MRASTTLSSLILLATLVACDRRATEPENTAAAASKGVHPNEPSTRIETPSKKAGGPHFTQFPGGDTVAAEFIEQTMSEHGDRRVLVYVGASWCEPCNRFHDAVAAGELDETFPDLELVEFDLDEHKAALTEAGYASRLVPLFSVPNADGEDQDLRMEGSIKGEDAVKDNLVPRLENLLARSKRE